MEKTFGLYKGYQTVVDLVIGAVMNYDYDKIEPWLVSLKETGYSGKIALIVYSMSKATIDKLEREGVSIFALQKDDHGNITYPFTERFNIMVERFAHIWYFLTNLDEKDKPNNILITDVGDVIFQSNPDNINVPLLVATEGIKYKDEPWSKRNMINSFGEIFYNQLKNEEIVCAGVIGGTYSLITDLCLQIFLICKGAPAHVQGGGGPDQAALNILLNQHVWSKEVITKNVDIVHLGTSLEAVKNGSGDIGLDYKVNGTDYSDKISDNLIIDNDNGKYVILDKKTQKKISIVHQYNRIPYLNNYFKTRFKK